MSSFSPRGAMILSISLVIVAGCDGTVERQREATRQALWKAHATATQRVLVKQVEVGRSTAEAPFSAATSWIEAAEMQAIDLSGCPSDFASAFQDYCAKLEDVALCAEIVEQAAEEFESGSRMIRDTKTELARKVGAVREALRRLRVVASGYTNSMDGTMRNAEQAVVTIYNNPKLRARLEDAIVRIPEMRTPTGWTDQIGLRQHIAIGALYPLEDDDMESVARYLRLGYRLNEIDVKFCFDGNSVSSYVDAQMRLFASVTA